MLPNHSPSTPPDSFRTPARLRRNFTILAICVPVACVIGLWGCWPNMVDMHARLEPWKIAGYWFGDAVALFFFFCFLFSTLLFGVRPLPAKTEMKLRRATAIGMILSLAIDGGINWYIKHAEDIGYANGNVTTASVTAVRKGDAPYILDCTYVDAQRIERRANIRVYEDRDNPQPPAGLGVAARNQLRNKPLPFQIQIRYDPTWPQRCWVDGAGTKSSNDLITLSHIIALFQIVMSPLFFMQRQDEPKPAPDALVFPTHRLLNAMPLAIEAAVLAFIGLLSGLTRLGLGP